jgi:NAD(P)-dependent dehydrogenase (short-subunit alcohol dehydrogenase family)
MTRTILVTGSASGIGRATCALLESRGHKVIGLDVNDADILADLSTAKGREVGITQATMHSGGKLDAVITCAGLAGKDAAAMVSVNYFGTVKIIEGLRPTLMTSSAPRVVIVSSAASIMPVHQPVVGACLEMDEERATAATSDHAILTYASTKLALNHWMRENARLPAWAGSGILMNAIAPGTVRTPMTAPILETPEGRAMLAQATPIAVQEYAEPEDISGLLAFLASPDCRYMVGQTIFIDGGTENILRAGFGV